MAMKNLEKKKKTRFFQRDSGADDITEDTPLPEEEEKERRDRQIHTNAKERKSKEKRRKEESC